MKLKNYNIEIYTSEESISSLYNQSLFLYENCTQVKKKEKFLRIRF